MPFYALKHFELNGMYECAVSLSLYLQLVAINVLVYQTEVMDQTLLKWIHATIYTCYKLYMGVI